MEKKLDGNYTRTLWAILNKSWRQHPTKQQLYGHLPPITKTIQVRRTRHAGHCWKSWDELTSDILLWTSSHGRAKAGQPAETYIQQLCADIECNLENLLGAMDDKDAWWEKGQRDAGHCWKSWDELTSDILLWTSSHGRAKAGQPAETYIQQLCADIECNLENLLGAMDDKDAWWEKGQRDPCWRHDMMMRMKSNSHDLEPLLIFDKYTFHCNYSKLLVQSDN